MFHRHISCVFVNNASWIRFAVNDLSAPDSPLAIVSNHSNSLPFSSSRPGRPPKRAPVGLSLAASHLQHQQLKKQRMDNGEYPYENGHIGGKSEHFDPLISHNLSSPFLFLVETVDFCEYTQRFLLFLCAPTPEVVSFRKLRFNTTELETNSN